jgi:hypothetical protein
MAFERIKAEIDLLLAALQDAPHDRFELYLEITQKLNELKAYGMPLPDDLVALEQRLEHELAAERREEEAAVRQESRALTPRPRKG